LDVTEAPALSVMGGDTGLAEDVDHHTIITL
jgi:hypothetical protein